MKPNWTPSKECLTCLPILLGLAAGGGRQLARVDAAQGLGERAATGNVAEGLFEFFERVRLFLRLDELLFGGGQLLLDAGDFLAGGGQLGASPGQRLAVVVAVQLDVPCDGRRRAASAEREPPARREPLEARARREAFGASTALINSAACSGDRTPS